MLEIEKNYRYAMAKHNPDVQHQFTYMVPVESYEDTSKTEARIWFFGTGAGNCLGAGGMDCIHRD